MSRGQNSPGLSRLAGVLTGIARENTGDVMLDFGVIQNDRSLLTNSYPISIPKSDYLVCRHLKANSESTSSASVGDHGSHRHSVSTARALSVGDRVLVAWVGNDAVVIDVILTAASVL